MVRPSKTVSKISGTFEMRRKLLRQLHCPRCKSTFAADNGPDVIEFGLLDCDCTTYPIVGGITILRQDALTSLTVDMLREGKEEQAVNLLLNRSSRLPGRHLLSELGTKIQSFPPLIPRYLSACSKIEAPRTQHDYFSQVVKVFQKDYFAKYLVFRPFEQSFWNLHAFLPFIDEHDGPILDFGGGWGHSSHLMHRVTGRDVYNLEINFHPLYVQRKFVNEDVGGVVIEPGMDLPFAPDTFGITLDLDGFHYVENKFGIATEYERTTCDQGSVLLLHTHDRAVTERGVPLTPSGYRECFARDTIVAGEEDLLSQFLEGSVRLCDLPDPRTSNQDLNIVISDCSTEDVVLETGGHPFETKVGQVRVTPLYDAIEHDEYWQLKRRDLCEKFVTEFAFSVTNTEPKYRLPKNDSVSTDLLYRGVLSPLPETYAPRPTLN